MLELRCTNMDNRKNMDVPQLTNEMQLNILHKVKSGQLSIDDALDQARMDKLQLLQKSFDLQEKQASQYNFSVHKFTSYRWQKRILQIDFNTKAMCIIEKGIVKRQFPFELVKNCYDAAGTKFTVSFKDHNDYELEAMSPPDKEKMMELINQIIYRNVHPAENDVEPSMPPTSPTKLHQGPLLLQKGGLASCKWKKYEAYLYAEQLTLIPAGRCQAEDNGDTSSSFSQSTVIHLSDGNASVESHNTCDTFTLFANKNEFPFRVLELQGHLSTEDIRTERDAWVKAIDQMCMDWKYKFQNEHMYEDLQLLPPPDRSECRKEAGRSRSQTSPISAPQSPMPRAKLLTKPLPAVPVPNVVPSLAQEPVTKPVLEQEPKLNPASKPEKHLGPSPESWPALVPQHETAGSPHPPPPPVPPPLPKKTRPRTIIERTRAFHWDAITHDKIAKSLWAQGSPRDIEIDTSRLYEHFGVKDSGHFSNSEPSGHVEIMLNAKIAHNFNIFLKSFPVQPKDLKDKLFIVNEGEGGLSDEHIAALRRYVPTPDDIEMYKSYKGDVNELHLVDQYMMELCNIPYLSSQLDLLLTLRELPIRLDDLTPLISQKIRMCRQLWGCEPFACVLEYLLAIGNYLNQHAGKEKAKGFRLSSLTKLSQLRGNERKFTLLHALVEQIMLHEPRLASFYQELAEFETVPGASIKGLTAEVDVVKNELQKVIQYRNSASNQHPKFSKDLKVAIQKHQDDLGLLTKKCKEMRKLYADILEKFGEPANQDSQELFGWIGQFVNEFRRIQSEFAH